MRSVTNSLLLERGQQPLQGRAFGRDGSRRSFVLGSLRVSAQAWGGLQGFQGSRHHAGLIAVLRSRASLPYVACGCSYHSVDGLHFCVTDHA